MFSMMRVMSVISLAALLLVGCDRSGESKVPATSETQQSAAANTTPQASATLPVVRLADLKQMISEAKEKNQVLVIDFWATWCIPCVEMFPELHDKIPAMGPNVRLVSVTIDSPGKYEALAVEFLKKHDALKDAYRIAEGENDGPLVEVIQGLGKQWQDMVVPVILVFGPDGELKDEFLEARAKPEVIVPRVREIVASSQR